MGEGFDGPVDLVGAGHENEDVSGAFGGELFERVCGEVPDGGIGAKRGQVTDVDWVHPSVGLEDVAGGEVLLEGFGVEGGGHHDELEIGAEFFLEGDCACEGDIAVEVSFVEFVEHDAADAFEEGVGEHHPEEDTFGDEPDAGAF